MATGSEPVLWLFVVVVDAISVVLGMGLADGTCRAYYRYRLPAFAPPPRSTIFLCVEPPMMSANTVPRRFPG